MSDIDEVRHLVRHLVRQNDAILAELRSKTAPLVNPIRASRSDVEAAGTERERLIAIRSRYTPRWDSSELLGRIERGRGGSLIEQAAILQLEVVDDYAADVTSRAVAAARGNHRSLMIGPWPRWACWQRMTSRGTLMCSDCRSAEDGMICYVRNDCQAIDGALATSRYARCVSCDDQLDAKNSASAWIHIRDLWVSWELAPNADPPRYPSWQDRPTGVMWRR